MENLDSFSPPSENPLKKYFRQPKMYVELPSKGEFYPDSTLEKSETGEFAVYAMTAKDEMMMRTPDALLNGEATVQLIKSCIPGIKDPWSMPTIDLDVVLVAIRIASYGEMMDLNIKTPVTKEEKTYQINLSEILAQFGMAQYNNVINLDEFVIRLKPLTYREFTEVSKKTFEEQRIFSLMNKTDIDESERLARFNQSFKKLTELNVTTLKKSIESVEIEGALVTNPDHISEFIDNVDRSVFESVLKHIDSEKKKFALKPMTVQATPEEIEKGVPETYEIPVSLDQSNFFA
jgi:hypothetical protein